MMKAQSERWIADRQARLDMATQQANANSGSLEDLANTVAKAPCNALATILKDFKGIPGAAAALVSGARSMTTCRRSNAFIRCAPSRNA